MYQIEIPEEMHMGSCCKGSRQTIHLGASRHPPRRDQTVPRAELTVAIRAVQSFKIEDSTGIAIIKPMKVTLCIDCKGVYESFEQWPRTYPHADADLWEEFWQVAKQIPHIRIKMRKVKAHGSFKDLQEGTISEEDYKGNHMVDAFARNLAQQHAIPDVEAFVRSRKLRL